MRATFQTQVMKKYVCELCGYVYDPAVGDPDSGVAPGTDFENLQDDWTCPLCGASKEDFKLQDEEQERESPALGRCLARCFFMSRRCSPIGH